MQYTQRGGRHLTLLASYTYSKSIDLQTQSETTTNTIPDVFNVSSERGLSDYDARHILNAGWVFTLPRITQGDIVTRSIFSDWVFGGIFNAHTGRPFDVTINNDTALDDEPNQRAALVPGQNPRITTPRHRSCVSASSPCKVQEWFNTNAFTYPVIGTFSNQQRNDLTGPAYLNTTMNLGRYFSLSKIREGMRLFFRADAYNIWNTPNLGQPQANFSCSTTSIQTVGNQYFGKSCATAGGTYGTNYGAILSTYGTNGNTSTNGRKMQFDATIYF